MGSDKPGFFEELQRRHVWRVAIAYVVTAWVLLQLASIILPTFGTPGWVLKALIAIIVILFPIALILAWAFEITPDGVRRTEPGDSAQARAAGDTRVMGRKLNTGIIVALVIAVALLLGNQFLWHKGMRGATVTPASASAAKAGVAQAGLAPAASAKGSATFAVGNTSPPPATSIEIPQKSVAVLPFTNEGAKGEQFFSDGLSEDLITALSQFDGLKVISRNSAFQFRDSKDSSAKIGTLLGVAHLLEGSVQRVGDEVRITATLVNASDGSIVWTERYDKPYKDLFALQDAITKAVADALKAKLLITNGAVVQSDRPPSGNLKAWQDYQRGRFYYARNTQGDLRKAIAAYTEAARLDPNYAAAYVHLSYEWNELASYLSGEARQQAYAKAHQTADIALQLAPDSARAHAARGNLLQEVDFDWRGAQAEFQRALQLAPNDSGALFDSGNLEATLGRVQSAVTLTRKALTVNPLNANWYSWLSAYLSGLGQLDEAQQAVEKAIALQPAAVSYHAQLAYVAIQRGKPEAALAAAQKESEPIWRLPALALATQIGPDRKAADAALQTLIVKYADNAPYQIAEVYALRRDPDNMFKWLDHAWNARDPGIQALLSDPFILRYRDDPRFAAFCKKVGLPTTTDAVAMK